MDSYKVIPKLCRQARKNAGLTQMEAADSLNWHINTLSRYERTFVDKVSGYAALANLYDVELTELLQLQPTKCHRSKSKLEIIDSIDSAAASFSKVLSHTDVTGDPEALRQSIGYLNDALSIFHTALSRSAVKDAVNA